MNPRRRQALAATAAFTLGNLLVPARAVGPDRASIPTRPIPSSGEHLPVVGIGTVFLFDFEREEAKYASRTEVIRTLVAGGGSVIDTAPGGPPAAYGKAEDRLGDLIADLGVRKRLFVATKYRLSLDRAAARASLQNSLQRLRTDHVDLMQAWDFDDQNRRLDQAIEWKREGLCRYVGITTSADSEYDAMAKILTREKPDFLQVNYSLGDRAAEKLILPTARDAGAAIIINMPFGRNALFRKVGHRPLPGFAAELGARSWAQLFLKFILGHPAVTAVIPGTDKVEYMTENLDAARGTLPDAAMRRQMTRYWDSLR